MPASVQRPKLLGCEQPRIWTPPLRKLTPKTSLGFAVIRFATAVLGITLHPWQQWLLIHALELRPDGSFRFRTLVVLVARQNGKSTVGVVLALFFLYVYGVKLVIGTAQDLDTAEEVWQAAVDFTEDVPDLAKMTERVVKVNGKKSLELVKNEDGTGGERYKVKAASRRAGRGLSGDLVLLDELREHQSWDAWAAVTKTMMAREDAQAWAFSNAGDATSLVLRYLRMMAHAELDDPDGLNALTIAVELPDEVDDPFELDEDETLGIFEWSAEPGCPIGDRGGWAQANPSMNHPNGVSERSINAAAKTDPEWVFRTEVLCQWTDGFLEGPFPPDSWEACLDEHSKVAPGGRIVVCVDVSHDRSIAHVGIAGLREDGLVHVGIVASRAGTDWVIPWLESDKAPPFAELVIQETGAPVSSLLDDLEAKWTVTPWKGADLARACGLFYDTVKIVVDEPTKGLRHRAQPSLDVAAGAASTRPVTDGYVWDRKRSPVDVSPLVAVTGALWAVTRAPEPPKRSVYEDRGLEVVG